MHLVEHVVEKDGVHHIDYLTGNDQYKKDWMSEARRMYTLTLTNPRSGKGLGRAAYLGARTLARRAREAIAALGDLRPSPPA